MTEFNKFNMYNMSFQEASLLQKDEVDKMVDEIVDMNMYNEVQDFVKKHFGEVEGAEWFDYPELKKSVYVLNEKDRIEICMLKNNKQYYGKGWKPIYQK